MHSDGGNRGIEEDKMTCLAVKDDTGELVSWDTYWVEDYAPSVTVPNAGFGWAGGYYQPYREGQHEDQNNALNAFRDRIMAETNKCIARTLSRQDRARKGRKEE